MNFEFLIVIITCSSEENKNSSVIENTLLIFPLLLPYTHSPISRSLFFLF